MTKNLKNTNERLPLLSDIRMHRTICGKIVAIIRKGISKNVLGIANLMPMEVI